MKEAPFYVGQRVVCLKTSGAFVKDLVYTVEETFQCSCGIWHIILSETRSTGIPFYDCDCRKTIRTKSTKCGGNVKYFAPIEENHYEDVTKELAKLPQDEVPDVKKVKELVN